MKQLNRREFVKAGGKAALFGLAFYWGVAGCNPGEPDEPSASGKAVIRLGYLPIMDHLTLIAHARKQFEYTDLRPFKFAAWPELAEALSAGAIDAGLALTPIGLKLRQNGVPIKALLLGHRNGSAITVKADSSIHSIEDLKGKTVAIPSRLSTHNILIHKVLSEQGIDLARINLLEIAPPEMLQAMAVGQIDAFIVAEPFGGQAELQGVGRVLMLSRDIWPNHICCVLNVHEKIIQGNPEAVQELVGGMVETGAFIESENAEAARLSQSYLGQQPAVIEHVLDNPKDRVTFDNLMPAIDDFSAIQRYMRDFGLAETNVDLTAYIDDSFARQAYRL